MNTSMGKSMSQGTGPAKSYNFRKKMWNRIDSICGGKNKTWYRDNDEMVCRENPKNRYPIPGNGGT